jgi:hypothetical protein
VSGETPDLSGGFGGGAGPGGGPAGGLGAGGSGAGGAGGHVLPVLIIGGLSGIVAMSALIATNVIPVHSGGSGASPRGLVLVACPGSGPVLAVVDPGQKLLVTGRSSDGTWLQVYLPGPALPYAWAPASELQPSGDTGGLPVTSCDVAAARPAGSPIVATASPSTATEVTATPPTPTPSVVADVGPRVAGIAAAPATIFYSWGTCTPDAKFSDRTKISSTITDPDKVASATLFYRLPGATAFSNKAMTHSGSAYSATVAVAPNSQAGNLDYYIVAKDGSPSALTTTTPPRTVPVKKCDIPPSVDGYTTATGPNGANVYVPRQEPPPYDPAVDFNKCSVFNDPSTNFIRVTGSATDPDDAVVSMVFRFTPKNGTLRSVTMTPIAGGFEGKLYQRYFNTLPPKQNAAWAFDGYFVATDKTGRSSVHFPDPGTLSLTEEACAP